MQKTTLQLNSVALKTHKKWYYLIILTHFSELLYLGGPRGDGIPEIGVVEVNKFKIALPLNSMSLKTHKSTITQLYTALFQVALFGGLRGDDNPRKRGSGGGG